MTRAFHWGAIPLLAAAVLANGALAFAIVVTQQQPPPAPGPERIVTASKPALAFVQTDYAVDASLPDMVIPDAKYNELVAKIQAMWSSGQIQSNAQAYKAAVNLVASNPTEYYAQGQSSGWTVSLEDTGTGFFVTENGYLVTAAHVVSDTNSDIRDRSVAVFSDDASVAQDKPRLAKDLLAQLGLSSAGIKVTGTQQNELESFWLKWIGRYLTVDHYGATYHLGTGTVTAGDGLISNGAPAYLVSVDPYLAGRDVAILKANITGAPTLPLATHAPEFGDPVVMIGYGVADDASQAQDDQPNIVTVKSGRVAQSTVERGGWTAFGTDAEFRPGDSGGPILDSTGNVLGLVSYTSIDAAGKPRYGGNFFVPTKYIRADLAADSVRPASGNANLTTSYYKALAEGDLHHYRIELSLLESISSQSSWDAYVAADIATTRSRILSGDDRAPPDLGKWVTLLTASALAVIVLTLLGWMVLAARAKYRPPSVPSPTPVPEPTQLDWLGPTQEAPPEIA